MSPTRMLGQQRSTAVRSTLQVKRILSSVDTNLASGKPYWPIHNGKLPKGKQLRRDIDCDVAIIGGGVTGALVAYELSLAGVETVLLDKGKFAMGSTSASTALLSYEYDELLSDLIRKMGEGRAVRALELCREALVRLENLIKETGVSCDFDRKTSLRLAVNQDSCRQLEKEVQELRKQGLEHTILDSDTLRSHFEVEAPLAITTGEAAQIDPFRFARALIRHAEQMGLRTFERTKVTSYEPFKGCVELRTAMGCRVNAKRVVIATGYESEKYLGRQVGRLNTDFCLISHPVKGIGKLAGCHFVEHKENYLYVSSFGNRVMVGMEDAASRSPMERSRLLRSRTKELMGKFRSYVPDRPISSEFRWAATFAKSKDSMPYIGEIGRFPHALFVLGYGGNGICSSAMLARMACELILTDRCRDAALFDFSR